MNFKDNISNLIGINIDNFLKDFIDFYDNYHSSIVQYYTISSIEYPKIAFEKYKDLVNRVELLLSKINFYKSNFLNIGYWDIVEQLEDIKEKLDLIPSYPKFYKVSFVKIQNNKINYETYITKQNETIEQVANKFDENWENIALLNNLNEEDYSNKGGISLILKSSVTESDRDVEPLESIIDIALGKNVLGKDIPNYFEFDIENNDLLVCTPEQTFLQTVKRLFELKMGSIPEFPDLGIQKDIMNESVKGDGFFFPVLLRQLTSSLYSDDTIINFTIDDIVKEGDTYHISASVQNRLFENLKFVDRLE